MNIMIEKFNQLFGLSGPLKRLELENALLKEFNDLIYRNFSGNDLYKASMSIGVEEEWGVPNYSCEDCEEPYNKPEICLMALFCQQLHPELYKDKTFFTQEDAEERFARVLETVYGVKISV